MRHQFMTWPAISVLLELAHRIVGTCACHGSGLVVPAAPPSKDARVRHGEGEGISRKRSSTSIACQSTPPLPAAADWMTALSKSGSANKSGGRVSDQPKVSVPPVRGVSAVPGNASSVPNRRAFASRCENGRSTAPEAARSKPGVPAPCHPGGGPVGRQQRRAHRLGVHDRAAGVGRRRGGVEGDRVRLAAHPRRSNAPRVGGGGRRPGAHPGVHPDAPRSRRGRERREVRCALARPEKLDILRPLEHRPVGGRSGARRGRLTAQAQPSPYLDEPLRVGPAPDTHRAERARCSPSG